jgi:hypothetical protein
MTYRRTVMGMEDLSDEQKLAVCQSSHDQQKAILIDMAEGVGFDGIGGVIKDMQDIEEPWQVMGLSNAQSLLLCWTGLVGLKAMIIEHLEGEVGE